MTLPLPGETPVPVAVTPTWAPLRHPVFRALWIAQFGGNIGTWAQMVGAQWLMGDLGGGGLAIGLVQTAATLPVFLFVVPAGALGDSVDRRKLLLLGQSVMTVAATVLLLVTVTHVVNPVLLLGLTAVMAAGQGLAAPAFQAVQPELVGRDQIPAAALLNGVNANVGRAIGPALGGVLIAAAGPAAAFALNVASFVGLLVVLARWRREVAPRPLGAERVLAAVRTGARYVRSAPKFGAVLARSTVFMLFASSLWALLPILARGPLRLGPGGYGLLLGGIGVGAVLGALVVPAIRARAEPGVVVSAGTLVYAATLVLTGPSRSVPLVAVTLVVTGLTWVTVLSTLNSGAQMVLPDWTRARALAYYQLAIMGGQALGGVVWGLVAQLWGASTALVAAGIGLAVSLPVGWRWAPMAGPTPDLSAEQHLPDPPDVPVTGLGHVLVLIEWRVPDESAAAFTEAMRAVGLSRRRTGATLWGLFRDVEDPECFVEAFTVPDWTEHLRQHLERGTAMDRLAEAAARQLVVPGTEPQVRHLVREDS
jgi:MFS family permease